MGMKYMLYGYNYPYKGYENSKYTNFLIVALFWFIVFSIKYEGSDISIRK